VSTPLSITNLPFQAIKWKHSAGSANRTFTPHEIAVCIHAMLGDGSHTAMTCSCTNVILVRNSDNECDFCAMLWESHWSIPSLASVSITMRMGSQATKARGLTQEATWSEIVCVSDFI